MADSFKFLIVWQLAEQLRRKIIKMTSPAEVKKDFRFVSDIRGSSRSVASNIAEGHGRFNPGEFHRFMEFASCGEDAVQEVPAERKGEGECKSYKETSGSRTGVAAAKL